MAPSKRPNILWIVFEDTNPCYGCYGDAVARTPNLDQFAAEGCRWTNAFSTAGVCAPARSAIITGMYPISIGTHHMRTTHTNERAPELPTPYSALLPHYVKCFPEYLRAAGYYCTNNQKTDYQFEVPLTAWDECAGDAHWRNRPNEEQPFFAVFNPTQTHESGMWPENCPTPTFEPSASELPPYFPDTPKVREAMARMYTHLENSDRYLAELLQQLAADGLAENTIVVHWSDHGPLPRGKRWPYDSGIHVPLIVRWPGHLDRGSVNENLVSTIDLAPTMLSLAGVAVPGHLQGEVFMGDAATPPREYIYASRDRHDEAYDMVRAVRDRRFKYLRNWQPELPYVQWIPFRDRHPIMQEMWRLNLTDELKGAQTLMFQTSRPVEELYDTQADRFEINNLAGDPAYATELARLREACGTWQREVGDLGLISEIEMIHRWYPDGQQPVTAPPLFNPISADHLDGESTAEIFSFNTPIVVQLHCATQGASIAYRIGTNENSPWKLYTNPLRFSEGEVSISAKAIRIGYKESRESSVTYFCAP